ncbi:hypothetical protein IKN40_05495 [bacterium]|nr:hypothetical protein [bacterium]
MKTLNEKLNESVNISLGQISFVNEAWGTQPTRRFKAELEQIFTDYDKSNEVRKKKLEKNKPAYFRPGTEPEAKLAKYPMQILIDKAGYTPKELTKVVWGRKGREEKKEFDKEAYGKFILQQLEEGKFTKEDLIKWWEEYSNNINKANWHDVKFLVKQIDPTRCWNPYYPKDDSVVKAIFETPARLVDFLKYGNNLTYDERKELREFLADPVNQEAAKAALKGVKNAIMKARPTFATGVENHIKSLIENCEYGDKKGSLLQMLKDEYKSSHNRTRYQGSNGDEGCEGSAIVGLILKAINKLYGFEVWHSMYMDDKDDSYYADIEQNAKVKGEVSDETLEGFLDDADLLRCVVNDKGASEKNGEAGTVSSSSFWTYYRHDFEVIIYKRENFKDKEGKEIFNETFKNVTVGSSYYSGGW